MINKSISNYALYFAGIFWSVMTVLYVFGIQKGMVAPCCMGLAALITHLFYKKHERVPEGSEQVKLVVKSVVNVLLYSWIPLLFIYFLVLDAGKQKLFISLFAPKVLPTAFMAIAVVTAIAFLGTWGTIKFYAYLLNRDIERRG